MLLRYEYVDDYLEVREPHRAAHLQLARSAAQRGVLRYGGAIEAEGGWEALLIFDTDDPQVVADFVAQDPFVKHGVLTRHRIERWPVVVGSVLGRR